MNNLIFLVANAIIVLATERAMNVFFEKRRAVLPITIFSYFLVWVTLGIQAWFPIIPPVVVIGLYFLALFLVALNYEGVTIRRIAAAVGGHYVMMAGTGMFQALAFFMPETLLVNHVGLAQILSSTIIFIIALLVFPLFINIKKTTINLNKVWLPFILLPTIHTFVELFHHIHPVAVTIILTMVNTLGIILIFFYLYNSLSKAFEKTLQSALHSQEKEYYFAQCQLMQESVDRMKAYRHDVKLHLSTLKDFTAGNLAATDYLDSLLGEIDNGEVYSDTGNIAFDSIINFKLKDVVSENINLQVKIFVPPSLDIDVVDVVTILGNLLDNAFDAVAKVDDKMIRLTVEANKGNLFIKVDNTFDGQVKYVKNKDGEDVIASRKEGSNHGYGLKNICKSVEKYNGHVDITHEDNTFSVGILMYVTS